MLIIQAQIKNYRLPFFKALHRKLAEDGISLRVAYSEPNNIERQKNDNCDLPPDYGLKVRAYWTPGRRFVWQPLLREVAEADLVIVEHANKFLINYLLLGSSALGIKKLAFWGHGRNRQSGKRSYSEWLKERTLNAVDWWFAYTTGTSEYLIRHGVRPDKITNVRNAIDTLAFRTQLAAVSNAELKIAQTHLGISSDSRIGLFCGSITRGKLPHFLVEASLCIREQISNFEILIIGAGPEQIHLEQAAARYPWFHYLGCCNGRNKAIYFRLAQIFLIPGAVGLGILDAFTAGLPTFTTDLPIHGPEIEYLVNERNGYITAPQVTAYSGTIVRVLRDPVKLRDLRAETLASADDYSIEKMADNFHCGILECLTGAKSAREFKAAKQS